MTKRVSPPRCSGRDYDKKNSVTECLVFCDCVLFPVGKSMLRMGIAVFVSFATTFYSYAVSAAKVPLGQCSGMDFQ